MEPNNLDPSGSFREWNTLPHVVVWYIHKEKSYAALEYTCTQWPLACAWPARPMRREMCESLRNSQTCVL